MTEPTPSKEPELTVDFDPVRIRLGGRAMTERIADATRKALAGEEAPDDVDPLTLDLGPGMKLTDEHRKAIVETMLDAIGKKSGASPDVVESFRAGIEAQVAKVGAEDLIRANEASVVELLRKLTNDLRVLPRAVQAVAKHSEYGAAIFQLGGVASKILQAMALLESARDQFEHVTTCSCKPMSEVMGEVMR